MQAPRTNAAAWSKAGRDAGDQAIHMFKTSRETAPRYDKIAAQGIQARSEEKIAATKAEQEVKKSAILANEINARAEINVDLYKAKNKARGTMRKAGLVAAAGQAFGLALEKDEPKIKPKQIDTSAMEAHLKEWVDKTTADANKPQTPYKPQYNPDGSEISETPDVTGGDKSGGETVQDLARKPGGTAGKVTGSMPQGGRATGLRLVNSLVSKGYSPVSAAAIAGNAAHESANFRAYEEYAPNTWGTKGVGFLQWTNADTPRRDEFESWSSSQGLNPQSFEASAGYIDFEMKGGKHWTGGMNTDKFKGIQDLNTAVTAFQNNYLRPNDLQGSLGQRQSYAQDLLTAYQNQSK